MPRNAGSGSGAGGRGSVAGGATGGGSRRPKGAGGPRSTRTRAGPSPREEAARIEAEKKAAAKAAAALNQEKLMTVARNLRGTILPAMATDAADELLPTIRTWIDELADRIEAKANAL